MSKLKSIPDFESHALTILPKNARDYYNVGQDEEDTIRWSREIYKKFRILPRMLRNVSNRDISTTVLGEKVSMPVGVSPTGFQNFAHPDGECGNARAAEAAGTVFVLSCYSTTGIDEVAKAAPNGNKWLMTSIFKDREATLHMVRKAEKCGFKAILVIVDNPIYGKCKNSALVDCLNKYKAKAAIFEEYLSTKKDVLVKGYSNNILDYLLDLLDDSLTWDDVAWLKSVTKLPIVLKGILTPEDAVLGVESGASAIFVSNHGGRQLDNTPATLEVLAGIAKAVGDKAEVYVDGGVTRGTDVFKALALGARMVFVGRSMLWGLACDGERGARSVLEILREEVEQTFALTGCSSVKQVTRDMIVHEKDLTF
ncbi:hydroxyacid oxidase 1-like [Nasonia vitripennis]|uniref:(S)-2-hydroxy-acid oxidase n=1 Tax=Nasonia vitripennis TaxID=7425 RepID=A0A7M7G6R2_NASVI|nr:hydroxyacid oxidase 1-like [Nasonia vitripennis]